MLHSLSAQEVLNLLAVEVSAEGLELVRVTSTNSGDVKSVDLSRYKRVIFYCVGSYGRFALHEGMTDWVNLPTGTKMDLLLRRGGTLYFCSASSSNSSTLFLWGFK